MEAPRAPEHPGDDQPVEVVVDRNGRLIGKPGIVGTRPAPCPPARRRLRSRRRSLLARRLPIDLPELITQRPHPTRKALGLPPPVCTGSRSRSVPGGRGPRPAPPFRYDRAPGAWRSRFAHRGLSDTPRSHRPDRQIRRGLPAPRLREGHRRRRPGRSGSPWVRCRVRQGPRPAGLPSRDRRPRLARCSGSSPCRDESTAAPSPTSHHLTRQNRKGRKQQGEHGDDAEDVEPDRMAIGTFHGAELGSVVWRQWRGARRSHRGGRPAESAVVQRRPSVSGRS